MKLVELAELVAVVARCGDALHPLRHRDLHSYLFAYGWIPGQVGCGKMDAFLRPSVPRGVKGKKYLATYLSSPLGSLGSTFLRPLQSMMLRCWFLKKWYERCEVGFRLSRVLSRT